MRPAAFLFDLDGTLVDTELVWTQAIVAWLADRGQTVTAEVLGPLIFGHSWLDIHAALHAEFPALGSTTPVEDAQSLRPYYNRLATDPAKQVVPGTVAFLKKAANIAPCVIVSGSPHADVQAAAELCGVDGLVKFVLGAEDYGRGKPAPDGFLRAAELLDVDASECVVIEDSSAGVAAGRAAGMHVIGLDRNTVCPQNFSGCEWLVRDLSELEISVVFDGEARGLRESVEFILKNSVQRVGHVMKKTLAVLAAVATLGVLGAPKCAIERDIPYYPAEALTTATEYQKTRCRLDFKRPVGATNFATVVWFHGGGLTGGNKHFVQIDDAIAQVAVNYRFLQKDGSVTGDTCIDDAAAAIAWALKHVASYGGDPKKVYVSGMSAGGYLTMMAGMDPARLAKWGFKPLDLAGLAPISGQATKHFNVRRFAGDADPQFVPKIDRLAPLSFCSKNLPPIVDICGEPPWEWQGRAEENRLLVASCAALGHPAVYYVECPYCSHGRVYAAGLPWVEMFVKGQLPDRLKMGARK